MKPFKYFLITWSYCLTSLPTAMVLWQQIEMSHGMILTGICYVIDINRTGVEKDLIALSEVLTVKSRGSPPVSVGHGFRSLQFYTCKIKKNMPWMLSVRSGC